MLLLRRQVYTIVTTALDGSSPPGRTAVCELLEKLQEPVPYLQALFQPISSRVSQVRMHHGNSMSTMLGCNPCSGLAGTATNVTPCAPARWLML